MVTGDAYFHSDTQWHSVVVGGMREGGRKLGGARVLAPEAGAATGGSCTNQSEIARMGYFALDVTQPDPVVLRPDPNVQGGSRFEPTNDDPVPACMSLDGSTRSGCDRPYPDLLWEFTDTTSVDGQPLDEDLNNVADLANPWSRPVLTRIKLLVPDGSGNDVEQMKFVVVFGGGLDAANKGCAVAGLAGPGPMPACPASANGNWIYMLDIEDGSVIYKRRVDGSVPSVAVVDGNSDSFADFIYFGTTAGSLYKVDVRSAQTLDPVTVRDRCGAPVDVTRITAAAWDPLRIFVTGVAGARPPIYQAVQALFIGRLNTHALVFGVGDRENLWTCGPGAPAHCGCGPLTPGECGQQPPDLIPPEPSSPGNTPGRLYVIVDDNFTTATIGLPRSESSYKQIRPEPTNGPLGTNPLGLTTNLLLTPDSGQARGWYMLLNPDERVITEGFGLSGILLFSTFQPDVIPEGVAVDRVCSRTGKSRDFVVFAFNGDPVSDLGGSGTKDRYLTIDDFVTNPFVEPTATKNLTGDEGGGAFAAPPGSSCTSDPRLSGIVSSIKSVSWLTPPNASYGNFFLRLGKRQSKEGVHYAACVPIGVVQANWKEN
jgi:Tfp pilus tip-associated adhesin PilY1